MHQQYLERQKFRRLLRIGLILIGMIYLAGGYAVGIKASIAVADVIEGRHALLNVRTVDNEGNLNVTLTIPAKG